MTNFNSPANTQTPNIVIENPNTRKTIRFILDVIGSATVIAGAVDLATTAFDIAFITIPVMAGYTTARVVFGFGVDNPNTPKG